MNWLSYQRLDIRIINPGSLILLIGSQRQSIRDFLRSHEADVEKTLILDNIDYHGSYMHSSTINMFSTFYGAFLQNMTDLPNNSMIVLDASLIPVAFYPQLQEMLTNRKNKNHTIFLIFGQASMIGTWLADMADYSFIHRITSNDQAFRLFGRFFPDMHEFVYGVETYAKYYEALVIDNVNKRALWYRPQAYS